MITLKNSLKSCQAHLHPFEKTHHYTIISPIFDNLFLTSPIRGGANKIQFPLLKKRVQTM